MIDIKVTALLAKRSTSRLEKLSITYTPGVTPAEIARREGFDGPDLEAILPIVNGRQVDLDAPLADGDALELQIGIAGG